MQNKAFVSFSHIYVLESTDGIWFRISNKQLFKKWASEAGRDWGQEEKGMTEDEMAGWHHRLDGRESE